MSATIHHHAPGVMTTWLVTLPNGKTYFATTYPDSAIINLRSSTTGRQLTRLQTNRLAPAILMEIAANQAQTDGPDATEP